MTKKKESAEKAIRDIRRATRRQYSAEEKIRIVLEGLGGEDSIAELCRTEGINQNLYYRWSQEFLDDYSRYILAWKLCDGMAAKDVSDTLELALKASGLESVNVNHRPRLLSDNGPSKACVRLRPTVSSDDAGQDRTLASFNEKPGADGKLSPSDVGYTTNRRRHSHQPDELKISLKSGRP